MNRDDHPLKYSVHTRLRQHHLAKLLADGAVGSLLEVGCGVGYLSHALGDGYQRYGLDRDLPSLTVVKKNKICNAIQGDATKLPFPDAMFDVVLCSEVLEHLVPGDDLLAMKEMVRVLKPAGLLLVTVPSLEGWRATSRLRNLGHGHPGSGEYHHRMGYAWPEMTSLLADTGGIVLHKRRYSMFLFSELVMDLLKWVYFRKHPLKDQTSMGAVKDSWLFRIYKTIFPALHALFLAEDALFCSWLGGHILIISLIKNEKI